MEITLYIQEVEGNHTLFSRNLREITHYFPRSSGKSHTIFQEVQGKHSIFLEVLKSPDILFEKHETNININDFLLSPLPM